MTREQLLAALEKAQQAYIELSTGNRGVSFSYSQGDVTRSVTYQQASIADLMALIQMLQSALGVGRRRPIRFKF
ncbi:gpW family head-tail joining protein [Limnobaculum allomyrinae]|nr:gpW family head-tail joining protein [Limnobaculum allomyrinae]